MILSARLNRLGLLKILLSVVYIGRGLVLVALIIGTREVHEEVYGASISLRTLVVDNPSREGLGGVLGVLLILNTEDRCTNSISVRHPTPISVGLAGRQLFSRIRVQCKPQSKVKRPRYLGFEKMGAQPPLVRLIRYIHSDRPTRGAISDCTEGGGEGGLGNVVRKDTRTTLTYGYLVREMLEEVIGGRVGEICGEGLEGVERAIARYKRVGGVYAILDTLKDKIYIGSSKNISRRILGYKSMCIRNKRLLREVKLRNWEGFKIIVVLKEEDKDYRERKEYSIIREVMERGLRVYNIYKSKEEHEQFGERMKILRLERTGDFRLRRDTRGKLRKIAKERGYGERLKEYRYKGGEDHPRAKKVKVWDTRTGEVLTGILKEVAELIRESVKGLSEALKRGNKYKGRYIITGIETEDKVLGLKREKEGARKHSGLFKAGRLNVNYKEVRIEDVKTGEVWIGPQSEVPDRVGGSRSGVIEAIKKGNKYKGRYILKRVESKAIR